MANKADRVREDKGSSGGGFGQNLANFSRSLQDSLNPSNWSFFQNFDNSTPQERNQPAVLTALGNEANAVNQAALVGGPVVGALEAFDFAQRGINTAVGGTFMAGADVEAAAMNWANDTFGIGQQVQYQNPLYRDGFEMQDVLDTYSAVWNGEVTPGQAISLTTGRRIVNAVDFVVPGDLQASIDRKVIEDSKAAINDPANSRGLISWMSGLHSDFDIYDAQQKDSAFNQGLGRWISGASDAAIMWWAAPDVLAAKGAGFAGRQLFTRALNDLGDLDSAAVSLAQHSAYKNKRATTTFVDRYGVEQTVTAKKTDIGRLIESLTKLNREQIYRHALAQNSTDASLVANVFGDITDFDEAATAFRAMAGDMAAADELFTNGKQVSKAAADALRLNSERATRLRQDMEQLGKFDPSTPMIQPLMKRTQDQIDQVLKEATETNQELKVLDDMVRGINEEAGIPNQVRFGNIRLSRFESGPNSPARLEAKAMKAAERAAGNYLWQSVPFKAGGKFGRTIRYIHSAGNYMRTQRMNGSARLADSSDDLIAEMDSAFATVPMFRRLARLSPESAYTPSTRDLEESERVTVENFRRYWIDQALNARTSTERFEVLQRFEQQMVKELRSEYNLSAKQAKDIFEKYATIKSGLEDQLKSRGWFMNDEDIVVAPEMQSMLAEGGVFTTDFNFLETVFRLDGHSGFTGGSRPFKKIGASADRGAIATFDAIWRPLVLMRLGYTQRNVAEGWLRELAAFGTVGYFKDRAMGTTAADIRGAAAAGYRARQFTSAVARPFRFYNRRQIKNRLQELRSEQEQIAEESAALRADEAALEKTEAELAKLQSKAEKTARKNLTDEARDRMAQAAGVVWEAIDDVWRGNVEAAMRSADEVMVRTDLIRPLWNVNSRTRAEVVSAFPDEEIGAIQRALQEEETLSPLQSMSDSAELPTWAQMKQNLTPDERAVFDRVKYGQTADDLEEFYRLSYEASYRATLKALRRGHHVIRRKGNGAYEVIHHQDEVLLDDVIEDRILLVNKDDAAKAVTHVRAKTYGETVDLRTYDQELPPRERLEDFPRDPETGDLPEDADLAAAAELVNDIGDAFKIQRPGNIFKLLDEYERILDLADGDQLVADALRMRIMAAKLPPTLRWWMEDKGLLVPMRKVAAAAKRAESTKAKAGDASREYKQAFEALKANLNDPEYVASLPEIEFLGPDSAFHGGNRIKGDQLSDVPPMTKANVDNLHGAGFYTTRDVGIGGEYLVGKAIADGVEDPVFYAIEMEADMPRRFLNLDAPMFNDPNFSPDELQQIEQEVMELAEDVLARLDDDIDFEDFYADIEQRVFDNYQAQVNPVDPNKTPRTTGENVGDYRQAMEEAVTNWILDGADDVAEDVLLQARYDAQMTIIDALKDQGALGMRHTGGKIQGLRDHEVFIWFTPPNMVRVDSVSDEALRVVNLRNRYVKLQEAADDARLTSQSMNRFQPYDQRRLDAAHLSGYQSGVIGRMMTENGIGRIIIDDVNSPTGYRIMVRPDMMSVGVDSLDAVPPGSMAGKDYIDNLIPQAQRDAAASNPAVFTPSGLSDEELLSQLGSQDAVNFLRGKSKGTPEAKAAIARWMETRTPDGGYTHVQIGGMDSNKFLSSAELIGNKKTGTAYGALLDADEVAQTKALILRNDDEFTELDLERQQLVQGIRGKNESLLQQEEQLKGTIRELEKRMKRESKKGSQSNTAGTGKERFTSQFADEFEMDGPLNEQNQGGLYADLSGSERRNNLELFGFSDRNVRQMRRTQNITEYRPGSELYFNRLAEQMNRYYRNDPVAMALLENPELAINDAAFADWLPGFLGELTETQRGRAWLRDVGGISEYDGLIDRDILRDDAFDDAYAMITEIRDELNRIIPVKGRNGDMYAQVWRDIASGDVNPNWLRNEIGWRSDLGDFKDYAYVMDNARWFRRATTSTMRMLGTLPENHLVRHPFFRARWREEMQRQVDLYGEQLAARGDWDGAFSQAQINAMNNVARKWALKQTNETLYTIQRISTPAHMFRFVAPFFPAWASTMRFWLLRMPIEKPENVIRYSYLFNAPEAIGAVQDRDGNTVEPPKNFMQRIAGKFTGVDENQIVIQMTPRAVKTFGALTGGNGTLRISKGSLDMMLQGEHFWLPGLGPLLQIPASVLAGLKPDWAEAMRTGNATNGNLPAVDKFVKDSGILAAMTKAAYESVLPFGPSREKSLSDVALESILPAWLDKSSKALGLRGDSAQFSNAAVSIYRDRIVDWELNDRQGPAPQFEDAIADAQKFFWWRAAMNLVLPFAPGFASKNEFYAQEWRRIERATYDSGGNYQDAQDQFLSTYGKEYFAFTQSLSAGSSGMSSTVGEYQEFQSNPELYGDLANIGEDASFMTMASRPFDTAYAENGFDPAVYAWQFNRQIEGAPGKFFRAGSNQRRDMRLDVDEELGWYEYNKYIDQLDPLLELGEIDEDTYAAMKRAIVDKVGGRYEAWFDSYNDIGGNRAIQSTRAMKTILGNEKWMRDHGDTGYAKGMAYFDEYRDGLILTLAARKASGGSDNIAAKTNQDVALVYEQVKMQAAGMDPTGELGRMIDRFFGSDQLKLIPEEGQ